MKTYGKFALLVVGIVGTLVWLAAGGIDETKTYYKTIAEVQKMNKEDASRRLRVGGDVEDGSIERSSSEVRFILKQDSLRLPVVYRGSDPLPDTFRPGAQALADGRLGANGIFEASKIQAKCASKYTAKPPQAAPINNSKASM